MSSYLVDAVRTPIGRYRGALAGIRPDDLAAHVVRELIARHPDLDPATVDDVFFGDANGAGEDNRDIARMAVLLAGLPTSVPGVTLNRLCGSGLEAVIAADRAIAVGDAALTLAGGVESMSRAPWVLAKPAEGFPVAHETLHSTTLGWRMINPHMPALWTTSLGECTELLADKHGITRAEQDEFALRSHRNADRAWIDGVFSKQVVPVPGVPLERDESIRADSTIDTLARLRPSFRPDGTVTAGNASPLNDGAAAVLVADERTASALEHAPLARIASRGVAAVDPHHFGIGPVMAAEQALRRAGIGWGDLARVELNEAFAAQALACLAEWPELDPNIVNIDGGAIAVGHPLGCSGTRIVGQLAHALHADGGGYGLAAICVGVGQGLAVVLEGL